MLMMIIPTYNEIDNLQAMVETIFHLVIPDLQLLIVDDASPDGTGLLADELSTKYLGRLHVLHRAGKAGLGPAYIAGFRYALEHGANIIGQMDVDFSHPPDKIRELLQVLPQYDVAIGSRYVYGGQLDKDWPFWRKALSRFGNFYARTILGLPLRDVTGGFRLWKAGALRSLPFEEVRSNGYVFQVEMAYLAHRSGKKHCETPIYFKERASGLSKMSLKIQLEAAIRVWALPWIYRRRFPTIKR
jgi:dolichol-phosphate mannosyltransferase